MHLLNMIYILRLVLWQIWMIPTDSSMRTMGTAWSFYCALHWRHNGRDSVSNHQPYDCLLNRLFRRRSKKTSKLCVTGLCAGNSPGTGEFPVQMASNAENVSIRWRHHVVVGLTIDIACTRCWPNIPLARAKFMVFLWANIETLQYIFRRRVISKWNVLYRKLTAYISTAIFRIFRISKSLALEIAKV